MNKKELANMIDHTNLNPQDSKQDIEKLCKEAIEHEFKAVCVTPHRVPLANELLKESGVKVDTVIGFPLGANPSEIKREETKWVLENGADEVDMVINIAALKDNKYKLIKDEIVKVVSVAKEYNAITKVIIETCYLNDEEIKKACNLAKKAEADFVKTSTGFGDSGAKVEDIETMKDTVGEELGIKASGGIKTYEEALSMINAGASRIGASSGVKIISKTSE